MKTLTMITLKLTPTVRNEKFTIKLLLLFLYLMIRREDIEQKVIKTNLTYVETSVVIVS